MIDELVEELLPELLPDVILDIAKLIGYRVALQLVQAMGGFDFAVPIAATGGRYYQLLLDAVGDIAAKLLIQEYGGERLYIPRCHAAFTQLRNQEFRAAVVAAVVAGEVQRTAIRRYAPQFGFTERWAYTVLREENQRHNRQMSLFY